MRLHTVVCAAVLLSSLAVPQESRPADPVRATIARAVEWIGRQAVPVEGTAGAVMFRGNAESEGKTVPWVYEGTAGVLIFLENAAAATNDPSARQLADATAKGLVATRNQDAQGNATWSKAGTKLPQSGLYLGDAGVGQAFLARARLRKDAEAKAVAVSVGESLVARAKREGDTMHWLDEVDIIFGAAGTALFLLDLGAETGDKRFTDAAAGAARWLIAKANTEPAGAESKGQGVPDSARAEAGETRRRLFWKMKAFGNQHMPNFSHGTAGVAYALARIGAATMDASISQAAKDGAEWLFAHAMCDDDGCRWVLTEGAKVCLGGWCHGPPGSARLFLLLHAQTGEARYLEMAESSARWLMSYAKAAEAKLGSEGKIPPSFCCGVAGALDFFCDLYRVTGKKEYADFASRAGEYLVRVAKPDGAGVKWLNGASSHSSSAQEHGIDLMLGASGDAFALVRLATLEQNPDPVRALPDRAVK